MEKSKRTQHEANSYGADKENRSRNESDCSVNVKRMKMRWEELSKSRKYVTIRSSSNLPATGAIKKTTVAERPFGNVEETSVTSKKRVTIREDDVFAKSRFKVYEDKEPKEPIVKESACSNVAKESDGHSERRGQHRNLSRLQLASSESRVSAAQPRFTPIDAPSVPLVPKKVKVLHRQSLMNANKKPNDQTISRSRSLTYKLPYDDQFIKREMEKDESMQRGSKGFRRLNITIAQRNIIVKFLTRLNAHSFYPSVFLYQTVRIFDAALDAKRIGVEELQLTALAAMWIALKRDHTVQSVPSATSMLAFSNDLYEGKTELLVKCEREILQSLNYEIVFPDPFSILCYDITSCNHSIFIDEHQIELAYYCGGYMIDLSLFDEDLMNISVVLLVAAVAETALYFVLEDVNSGLEPVWSKWRAPHTAKRYSEDEISGVRSRLIEKISESNRRNTDGEIVFKKYSRSRYGKISRFLGNKVRLFLAPECSINLN